MTLTEALNERSRTGGCFRRECWPPNARLFVLGLEVFWADRMMKWVPDVEDLLGTDYVMVPARQVPPLVAA